MTIDAIEQATPLFDRLEKVWKFESKYQVMPKGAIREAVEEMRVIAEGLPNLPLPSSNEEVLQAELKRRLIAESKNLEHGLNGKGYDFQSVVETYLIPKEDLDNLHPWLVANRQKTLESVERMFAHSAPSSYELDVPLDVPRMRVRAVEVVDDRIQHYHTTVGSLLERLTKIGEFLRDIRAVPTTRDRSYFSPLTKTLALSVPALCFLDESANLHIRDTEMIRLYGHEGMGHALNTILTQKGRVPSFLKRNSAVIAATAEGVAQFYEKQLITDLFENKETQRRLGIAHNFDGINQELRDTQQLGDYMRSLDQYAITVVADKTFGDPQDPKVIQAKIKRLAEVTLNPHYPYNVVQGSKDKFDSEGNLSAGWISELRYCAKPVSRALEEFKAAGIDYSGRGRSLIDKTILTGYWTPQGLVENARVVAQSQRRSSR